MDAKVAPKRRLMVMLVGLLVMVHGVLTLTAASRMSLTADEPQFLFGGYVYWRYGDYRVNSEGGNLSQRVVALPLLALNPPLAGAGHPGWVDGDYRPIRDDLLYNPAYGVVVFSGRAMVAALSCVLGLAVFFWSARLFGFWGGLVSLALYAFSPTFLANGGLITADLMAALMFLLGVGALWNAMQRVTGWSVGLSCLAAGGLVLTKFSGLVIGPIGLILAMVQLIWGPAMVVGRREVRGRWARAGVLAGLAAVHVAAVWGLVWLAYGLRFSQFGPDLPAWKINAFDAWIGLIGGIGSPLKWCSRWELLPQGFLDGLAYMLAHMQWRWSFFNGQVGALGWWGFFPYCFLVKTPVSLFVVLILAGWGAARRWALRDGGAAAGFSTLGRGLYRTAPLWVLLGVYGYLSLSSHLNLGQRHLMPIYPVLFIFAGAAGWWIASGSGARVRGSGKAGSGHRSDILPEPKTLNPGPSSSASRYAVVILLLALGLYVAEAMWTWPNYLAYFNAFDGGPSNGYRHLVDSSLDWGQALPALRQRLDEYGVNDPAKSYLSYFGGDLPARWGIKSRDLPGFGVPTNLVMEPWRGGVYAISTTMLSTVYLTSCRGPWCVDYEKEYQRLRPIGDLIERPSEDPERQALARKMSVDAALEVYGRVCQLRLGRLCAYLRHREPDDQVGYAINLYLLTDAEVNEAIYGQPVELELGPRLASEPPKMGMILSGKQR